MTDQTFPHSSHDVGVEAGRGAALLVYGLYLLSIPSAGVFALVGVILAYVGRATAEPGPLQHLNEQIRIWWIAFAWGLALFVVGVIGWALTPVLIGFPILWIAGLIGLVVMIWFTIKSALGLIALFNQRPA